VYVILVGLEITVTLTLTNVQLVFYDVLLRIPDVLIQQAELFVPAKLAI
jgi:hypothetical protein